GVGDAMRPDGVQAAVREDDLKFAARGRIVFEHRFDVRAERAPEPHFHFPLSSPRPRTGPKIKISAATRCRDVTFTRFHSAWTVPAPWLWSSRRVPLMRPLTGPPGAVYPRGRSMAADRRRGSQAHFRFAGKGSLAAAALLSGQSCAKRTLLFFAVTESISHPGRHGKNRGGGRTPGLAARVRAASGPSRFDPLSLDTTA